MPLISQQVLSLLGGVSQQADKQRASSQMISQLNCFDSITYGKIKRPPTTHVAQLSTQQWTTPYLHAVNRDAADKYHVVIENQACMVFDGISGQQYPVLAPQGTSYLKLKPQSSYTLPFKYSDSFSDTNGVTLANHISTSGPGWVVMTGKNTEVSGASYIDGFTIEGNMILPNNGGGGGSGTAFGGYYYNQTPLTADYAVSLTVATTSGSDQFTGTRIWARMALNGASPATPSGYFVNIPAPWAINGSSTVLTLNKQDSAGNITVLGSYTGLASWPASTSHVVGISVSGTSISMTLDGTIVLTETDTAHTAAGLAAIDGYDRGGGSYLTFTAFALTYAQTVSLPNPVQAGFRFATVQDTTFIVNQTVAVEPTVGEYTQVRYPEALITIALADYATNYFVTINDVTVGVTTPSPSAPGSRTQISTDYICGLLYTELEAATGLSGFTFTRLGQTGTTLGASTIYLTRSDNADFTISANDGLNDAGIVVVKGTCQNIAQLPARALDGMVVKVQPDPQNNVDVAYYEYDNFGSANLGGIWNECAAPGTLTNLNPLTMPWQLTRSGDVVAGYPAAGPIPLPSITSGFTTPTYAGGSYLGPTGTHARGGVIGDNGDALTWSFTTSGAYEVTFVYDVDVGALPSGYFITLAFENLRTSAIQSFVYQGGTSIPNVTQTFTDASAQTSGWSATLTYSTGGTPGSSGTPELSTAQQGSVSFHSNPAYNGGTSGAPFSSDYSGINGQYVQTAKSVALDFNSVWEYAGGVQVSVAITGATTANYTPATNMSASQLATALASGLVFSGYTLAASGNTLTITKTSGSPGTCTVTYAWNNTEQYYNSNLELAPGSLVGYLFTDLTDGSSAIITANGTSTITFAGGLSGGITNSVRANDLCSITGTSGELFFVLQPCNWTQRGAGDDTTNPFPSFTYNTINEVGFTSGRLLLLSGENVVCSGSNDVFDFFRTTVTSLLDTDRIDIQANSDTVSDWFAVVHWAEGCWLWAGNVQAQLPTSPALSNSTVSIDPQTKYQAQPTLRPLAMDRRVYFARLRSPNSAAPVTEILEYQRIRFPFFGFIAQPVTKVIPTYLQGTPQYMVGDPVLEIMFVLTSAYPNQLYPYVYHFDEQQQLQMESWSTWQLDTGASILAIDMLDGVLGLIIQRTDGVYLEYIDLQMDLYEAPA